jgi:hypothetical protein
MDPSKAEFGIPHSGFGASNGRYAGEISRSKKDISILVFPGGRLEEFVDERKMGYCLIRLEINIVPYDATRTMYVRSDDIVEDRIYTRQRGIMLDPIVQIQLSQIKRVLAVILFQHIRRIVWDKKGQGRRNVGRCLNRSAKLFKGDISTVMRQNAWIGNERRWNIKHSNSLATYHGLPSHSIPDMRTYCLPLLVGYTLAMFHLHQDGPPAPHVPLYSLAPPGYIE